jgi:ribosome-associated protein
MLLELLLEVHHVMPDAELPRHTPRIVCVLDAAALLMPLELLRPRLRPQAHRYADHFVALLYEQSCCHGAINSARHTDNDAGAMHDCVSIPSRLPKWDAIFTGRTTGTGAHFLDSEALAHLAVDVLSDHQALDIALLDISRNATFTDYFVIATAQSPLQFSALAEYLEKALKPEGHDLRHREGSADSGWMLLDFGDIIVHVFSPEQRAYYRLEELWGRTSPVVRFAN